MSQQRERRLIRTGMIAGLLGFVTAYVWARPFSGLALVSLIWIWITGVFLMNKGDRR